PPLSTLILAHLTCPPAIHTLSLDDALPIWPVARLHGAGGAAQLVSSSGGQVGGAVSWSPSHGSSGGGGGGLLRVTVGAAVGVGRSEEHTSELQSRENLVCRLPLEKKKPMTK